LKRGSKNGASDISNTSVESSFRRAVTWRASDEKFATIYAGAALAIAYQILPWSRSELLEALVVCERAHVDHVARFVSSAPSVNRRLRPVDPLESLRQHVRQNRSKFADLRKGLIARNAGHDHIDHSSRAGLR
jgi:hypothetical protein